MKQEKPLRRADKAVDGKKRVERAQKKASAVFIFDLGNKSVLCRTYMCNGTHFHWSDDNEWSFIVTHPKKQLRMR